MTEGSDRRGKQLGRWKVRVGEDKHEKGTGRGGRLQQAKRKCLEMEVGHHLGGNF